MLNWAANCSGANDRIVVTASSRAGLLADLEARLAGGCGFSVATLNLDHVVKLRRDPVFRRAYARVSHVTADGNPIVWLSRIAGHRVELVPGSELVEPTAALATRRGVPVAFLGSTEATLVQAAETLRRRNPGLDIAVQIAPAMGFDPAGTEADAAIAEICASGARICYVALGAPKQERFVARAQERLPKVGFIAIGAGLDFVAGTQIRAPAAVRAVAGEWLWRLVSNPFRLGRRYAFCLAILPRLAVEALQVRRSRI